MLRRDFSKTLLASTAGGALLKQPAQAQSCNVSCYPRTPAEIAAGVTPINNSHVPGNVLRYGADSTGAADCAASFRAAVSQWVSGGSPPHAPAGLYRVDSTISYVSTTSAPFTQGFVFLGDGARHTIIDNRVANGPLFSIDTNSTYRFQVDVRITGLRITTRTKPAASDGVRLRRAYNVLLEDVHIDALSADGVHIVVTEGDGDACNMVTLRRCRIESCARWGVNLDVSGAHNEMSFLRLEHTFIQACGTTSTPVPPQSGGMRWKGQILHVADCAFTTNENCGLYVEGGSGLPNTVSIEGTAFENNKKAHLYCTGISGFTARRCQLYSNDSFIAQHGMLFDASSSRVQAVQIDGMIVRATASNNAYTAFSMSGANLLADSCRVRNVSWENFDYSGQSRFAGVQFDSVAQQCELVVLDATTIRLRPCGRGNKSPLRLRGRGSTTGEWIATQLAATGVNQTNSGLVGSTRYYVYLYDNNGTCTLELSTTATAMDTGTGYTVMSGDATRLFVGSVVTDDSGRFATSGTGWLNPAMIPGPQVGVPVYLWADSSKRLRIKPTAAPTSDADGTVL